MAAVETQTKAVTWNDFRSKRTKAMPKNTLFGTSLELQDENDLKELAEIDPTIVYSEPNRKTRRQFKKSQNTKMADYETEEHKDQMEKQKHKLIKADKRLRSLQERAVYFEDMGKPSHSPPVVVNTTSKPHQWITDKDILHAAAVNKVGLDDKDYNWDRYGHKPPLFQETIRELYGSKYGRKNQTNSNRNPNSEIKSFGPIYQDPSLTKKKDVPQTAITLPPNIRHSYGAKVCDALLNDPDVVKRTMEHQEKIRKARQHIKDETPQVAFSNGQIDPLYQDLGNMIRYNIFPGYSTGHKISHAKDTYTDEVYKSRYKDPDQYRYQRDALSMWAEHNVLRQRMKRLWDQHYGQPKKNT